MRNMRLVIISLMVWAATTIIVAQPDKQVNSEKTVTDRKYSLESFSLNLNSSLSPPNHLWVMSGWSTVNPVSNTVMGVGDCIGPPLAGMDFKLTMTIEAN